MRAITSLLAALATVVAFLSGPLEGSTAGSADTGVVDVSHAPGMAAGEEPLAIDPLNPQHLAAVSNTWQATWPGPLNPEPGGDGAMDTAVYISHDGGRTWKGTRLDQGGLGRVPDPLAPVPGFSPEFNDAANVITADADAIWDRHGNLYFESGALHDPNHNGDEVASVWRSTDGGDTWAPPVAAVSVLRQEHEELDRPWFAVDNSGGARDGTLYMTFETGPFTDDPPKVFVKHSTDHGQTWSQTVRIDDGTYQTQFNPRARPIVDGAGTLYVAYDRAPITSTPLAPYTGPIELVVARSSDGGQAFERVPVDTDVRRVSDPDEALPHYAEMISAIAADQSHAGRVAVAWPQADGAGSSRIVMRYTSDGGTHWSQRIDAADDPATTPNQHDHVALRWLPDGRLAVLWRDRRATGGGWADPFQEWARLFQPDASGGLQPVGRAVEFTDGPQMPTTNSRGSAMPDEFQGLVASNDALMATWAQVVGDYSDVMFRSVPLSRFAGEATQGSSTAAANPGTAASTALPNTSGGVTAGPLSIGLLLGLAAPGIISRRHRTGGEAARAERSPRSRGGG